MKKIFEDIISFIRFPEFEGIFLYLKVIFIIINLIFFVGIILLLLRSTWLKRRILEDLVEISTYRPFGRKKTFKQWTKVAKRLEVNKEAEYKLAVIEADSLLNDILKKMGYSGEAIGEKLKQLDSATLPNIEQVWKAHKIRNNIVHDPDYQLTLAEARKAIEVYEKVLRDLEVF